MTIHHHTYIRIHASQTISNSCIRTIMQCSAHCWTLLFGFIADANDHHEDIIELHAICKYLSLPADVVSILPLLLDREKESSMTEVMIERYDLATPGCFRFVMKEC